MMVRRRRTPEQTFPSSGPNSRSEQGRQAESHMRMRMQQLAIETKIRAAGFEQIDILFGNNVNAASIMIRGNEEMHA